MKQSNEYYELEAELDKREAQFNAYKGGSDEYAKSQLSRILDLTAKLNKLYVKAT